MPQSPESQGASAKESACEVVGSSSDSAVADGYVVSALKSEAARAPEASANHCCDAELDGKAPDATDNANYFCEYAYLYHQMDMLEDAHRTGSYYNAIVSNPSCFKDKVVLDVGAGTCVLAIFAAQAGAKEVFAVEATDMAKRAKRIVEANGLSDKIRVIQGTVESITLPYKVDIIVSEWMGYLLLRESMLDSVLFARDRWLKPGGSLYPSHTTLFLAPTTGVKAFMQKGEQVSQEEQHWATFESDMTECYGIKFDCMKEEFLEEQQKYHLQMGTFVNLTQKQMLGPNKALFELDLLKVQVADLITPTEPDKCTLRVVRDGAIDGFCGYFDAYFRGSPENPTEQEVTLTTAPTTGQGTHWGQQAFGFYPPLNARRGDALECSVLIRRQKLNPRLLILETTFELTRNGESLDKRSSEYFVD
jgi:protein arginine N-methyltransferase 1